MNQHIKSFETKVSRRQVMIGAAGLSFAIALGDRADAAKKWGVPVEELTTEPSVVVHAKSVRRLGYSEIAVFAEVPAQAPAIKPEELKKPGEFRLISKDVMRVDLPSKVNGGAKYGI